MLIDIVKYLHKKYECCTPLLLNFPQILVERIDTISNTFLEVKHSVPYCGKYQLIYPLKVNQYKSTVSTIYNTKKCGLEVSNKADLLVALSIVKENNIPIICNGYKDRDYMTLVFILSSLGRLITVVIEKESELDLLLSVRKRFKKMPHIGVRYKLSRIDNTNLWSSKEKSKFGLTRRQLLNFIICLSENDLLQQFTLLHCHFSSQITKLADIKGYLHEVSVIYVLLKDYGAQKLSAIDIGGGLAVDYSGIRGGSDGCVEYSLKDYAYTVLSTIKSVIQNSKYSEPTLYSESGRALVSHHTVFITDIVGQDVASSDDDLDVSLCENTNIIKLYELYTNIKHYTVTKLNSILQNIMGVLTVQFHNLELSLSDITLVDKIIVCIKKKLLSLVCKDYRSHRGLYDALEADLVERTILNFSVFQSIPDVNLVDQLFPILPINHLNDSYDSKLFLYDLTCDSDGKVSKYYNYQGLSHYLMAPHYDPCDPYLIAVFLVGAYERCMGNIHNSFGQVSVAEINLEFGRYVINEFEKGHSNNHLLENFGYNDLDSLLTTLLNKEDYTTVTRILYSDNYMH